MAKTTLTQAKELAIKLQSISDNVTAKDRQACITKGIAGKTTISNYLNGEVRDIDTGLAIYNFMQKRIQKRQQAIA